METEREMLMRVGRMMFGQLANELPEKEFAVLEDLWRQYRMETNRFANQSGERKDNAGEPTGEQAA